MDQVPVRLQAGLALLLFSLLLALPSSAAAFDSSTEAANFSKTNERFTYGQADGSFQAQVLLQSLSGTESLAQAEMSDPGLLPANPCATGADICEGDPRLYDWSGRLGVVRQVHWVNRDGAVISGHEWAPLRAGGRLPAVVIVNGDIAPEQVYWWAAQDLARHGYVVLTFDPEGHGASSTLGSGPNTTTDVIPQQTAGAVDDPATDAHAVAETQDALSFLLSGPGTPYHPPDPSAEADQARLAAKGAVDASDPLRALVDPARLGLAGHSRGADAVSVEGSLDQRVKAIVAWDNLTTVNENDPAPLKPRVPALGMSADYYYPPTPNTSAPTSTGKATAFNAYRAAGVDTMEVVVRGGTHYEWSYLPSPAFPASLRGIDAAAWYTRAWFDKYLRGDPSADARLLSDRWRGDTIEAGIDPAHDGNLFSFYYPSEVSIRLSRRAGGRTAPPRHRRAPRRPRRHPARPGRSRHSRMRPSATRAVIAPFAPRYECLDLRSGCAGLVPAAHDGYPGSFSYLDDRAR